MGASEGAIVTKLQVHGYVAIIHVRIQQNNSQRSILFECGKQRESDRVVSPDGSQKQTTIDDGASMRCDPFPRNGRIEPNVNIAGIHQADARQVSSALADVEESSGTSRLPEPTESSGGIAERSRSLAATGAHGRHVVER